MDTVNLDIRVSFLSCLFSTSEFAPWRCQLSTFIVNVWVIRTAPSKTTATAATVLETEQEWPCWKIPRSVFKWIRKRVTRSFPLLYKWTVVVNVFVLDRWRMEETRYKSRSTWWNIPTSVKWGPDRWSSCAFSSCPSTTELNKIGQTTTKKLEMMKVLTDNDNSYYQFVWHYYASFCIINLLWNLNFVCVSVSERPYDTINQNHIWNREYNTILVPSNRNSVFLLLLMVLL